MNFGNSFILQLIQHKTIFKGPPGLNGLRIRISYTRWFKYDQDWFVCKQV